MQAEKAVAVINKADKPIQLAERTLRAAGFAHVCTVSALEKTGLSGLEKAVSALFPLPAAASDGEILTNARQAEAVSRAREALHAAREALGAGVTPDAVLSDAEIALDSLGKMTGKTATEEIISHTFARFCVGK